MSKAISQRIANKIVSGLAKIITKRTSRPAVIVIAVVYYELYELYVFDELIIWVHQLNIVYHVSLPKLSIPALLFQSLIIMSHVTRKFVFGGLRLGKTQTDLLSYRG